MANVRPKKFLGQHFLTDLSIADRIAATINDRPDLPVVEVGPGTGVLTRGLLRNGRDLTVIELDRESVEYLRAGGVDGLANDRIIEAGNEFRGTRIGHGEGALWRNGNWKLVRNLWTPSWGESYRHIAQRVGEFAQEKVRQYAGRQIIAVSHESPIWSYRHLLETGHPEHNMLLRHTALASITSITYDSDTGEMLSITYVDPAKDVR